MRAWLLTSTTYGSWLRGDPRGSVTSVRDVRPAEEPTIVRIEHDIPGEPYEDAIPELQDSARNRMKGPPLFLDREKAEVVLAQFQETAKFRRWTLRAAAIMYNHFHLVVEVPGDPQPGKVLGDFKAYGTRALNRRYGRPLSETWWSAEGSKRILRGDAAVAGAMNYVLKKQPKPLVVWSMTEDAPATE